MSALGEVVDQVYELLREEYGNQVSRHDEKPDILVLSLGGSLLAIFGSELSELPLLTFRFPLDSDEVYFDDDLAEYLLDRNNEFKVGSFSSDGITTINCELTVPAIGLSTGQITAIIDSLVSNAREAEREIHRRFT